MPGRPKNSLDPLVLFHGCDKDVADSVLRGEATLQPSENDYDWLGNGIYFWVDSPERALSWAKQRRPSPSVLGAFAYPGNCLNLTDYGVMNELAPNTCQISDRFSVWPPANPGGLGGR